MVIIERYECSMRIMVRFDALSNFRNELNKYTDPVALNHTDQYENRCVQDVQVDTSFDLEIRRVFFVTEYWTLNTGELFPGIY